jgi:hypothetical protein
MQPGRRQTPSQQLPHVVQWIALNSMSFFLAVQVFYHASTVALVVTFLDQREPPQELSSVLGAALLLAIATLFVGAAVGLFMAVFQGRVLRRAGISCKNWLPAGVAGGICSFGLFVYSQLIRAYLEGLDALFDPPLLLSLASSVVLGAWQWRALRGQRPYGSYWALATGFAFAAGIISSYGLRHTYFMMLIVTLVITIVYSVLVYRILVSLCAKNGELAQMFDQVAN